MKNFKGWKSYSWDMSQNPYLHDIDKLIDEICQEKGLTREAPFIQREYFGCFVYDIEAMPFKDHKVYENEIPEDFIPTDVAIGVDYGHLDYDAIVALAYNRNTKQSYVISESKFNKSGITPLIDTCVKTYEYSKKFCIERNPNIDFGRIAFYCDTNEQSISYEMSTRYHLPVFNAYKYNNIR